jgi:hypothetical protein
MNRDRFTIGMVLGTAIGMVALIEVGVWAFHCDAQRYDWCHQHSYGAVDFARTVVCLDYTGRVILPEDAR